MNSLWCNVEAALSRSASPMSNCKKSGFASDVENTRALPNESVHSCILGMGFEWRTVTTFSLLKLTQKRRDPSFFQKNSIGSAHSVSSGSISPILNIISISDSSNSLERGPALYGAQFTGRIESDVNSIRCFVTLIQPRWPSYIEASSVIIPMNLSRYVSYLKSIRTSCLHSRTYRSASSCSNLIWHSMFVCRYSTSL